MKKRVLALLLALMMALSILPALAVAEGNQPVVTPDDVQTQSAPEETPSSEEIVTVPLDGQTNYADPAQITVTSDNTRTGATTGTVKISADKACVLYYTTAPTTESWPGNATDDDFEAETCWPFTQVGKDTVHTYTVTEENVNKELYLNITDIASTDACKVWIIPSDTEGTIDISKAISIPLAAYVGTEVEEEKASLKVYFTFYDGKSYNFPVARLEVTAVEGTAEKYGLENAADGHTVGGQDHSIKAGQVSVLDALLCAHETVYGTAFTKSTMSSYFGGSSSYVSKIFGVSGGIGFAVNDAVPIGPMSDGYAVNEYTLSEGDDVYFFVYSDPYWMDYLSYFDKKEVEAGTGEEITLNLKGFSAMESMWYSPGTPTAESVTLGNLAEVEVYALDDGFAFSTLLGKTDENGNITISFDKEGTYYVSAMGEASDESPITGPLCKIVVTGPKANNLNGMLVYTGYNMNNDSVILRNSTDKYTTTNVFSWYTTDYDLGTVNDASPQLRFKLNLASGAKATFYYTDTSGEAKTKAYSGSMAWMSCLVLGKNTVKIVVTPPTSSGLEEKTYTVNVNVVPSLTALSLTANGREAYLDSTFSGTDIEYSADVSSDTETVTVSATPKDETCTVTYNGQADCNVNIADTDKIVVRVEKSGFYTDYTINLNKVESYSLSFDTTPTKAVARLKDYKGNQVTANANGVYDSLLPGSEYTWVVTCKGYVSKTGTISGPEQLTNGVLAVELTKAEKNALTCYDAEWPTFRNSNKNNALTSTATPVSSDEAELKWAQKYGSGWSAPPSIPIIVNERIYFISGKQIICADKETGETIMTGTLNGSAGYSTNSLTYGEGMLFAQVGSGKIQAFRADTLESLWVTESIGGQTISPITYYNGYIYTGVWYGETKVQNFACFSVTDEDPTNTLETKYATWLVPHAGGYYWSGAYVNSNCAVFGSDDGTNGCTSPTATLFSVNPVTGSIIDRIDDIIGDIRSCVVYNSGRVYFTTKGGYLYSVGLNSNGTFNHDSVKYISIGSMSTSTPVIYKNRLYVGCSGAGYDWDGDSSSGIAVVDVSGGKLEMIYKASTPGYPQAGPLVSTAYEKSTGKVYIYTTYNNNPGGIYLIEDSAGQTEPSENNGDLFIPDQKQYCISTICADSDGTLYYKNDSGYIFAVKSNSKVPVVESEDKDTSWPGGKVFGDNTVSSSVPTASNVTVTAPTVEMPVTGGEDSLLPIAMLIAGVAVLLVIRRMKRV